jgi:hypothetical protein
MENMALKLSGFSASSLDEATKMYYDKNALITIGYNS